MTSRPYSSSHPLPAAHSFTAETATEATDYSHGQEDDSENNEEVHEKVNPEDGEAIERIDQANEEDEAVDQIILCAQGEQGGCC